MHNKLNKKQDITYFKLIMGIIFFDILFQPKMLTAHWRRLEVEATLSTDYLCLQSGHNDLLA